MILIYHFLSVRCAQLIQKFQLVSATLAKLTQSDISIRVLCFFRLPQHISDVISNF